METLDDLVPDPALVNRWESICQRIENACHRVGRSTEDVTLVAVSKYVALAQVRGLLRLGYGVFGENYVQDAEAKWDALVGDVENVIVPPVFHLIGPLQRNKVKRAVGLFEVIHSVDRIELATEISKIAVSKSHMQQVLIQVNVSGEPSKSGCIPDRVADLCKEVLGFPGLELRGLMMIGTYWPESASESLRRSEFKILRELRDNASSETGVPLAELSMGMSADFDLAIEEGATFVRVGSALFGERA